MDLPTAILLNLRQFDPSTNLNGLSDFYELVLWEGDQLYVVDGQHRVEALVGLYKESEENQEKWGKYVVPFICLLGGRP